MPARRAGFFPGRQRKIRHPMQPANCFFVEKSGKIKKEGRDAIIMYGLSHRLELSQVNELLFAQKEEPLC